MVVVLCGTPAWADSLDVQLEGRDGENVRLSVEFVNDSGDTYKEVALTCVAERDGDKLAERTQELEIPAGGIRPGFRTVVKMTLYVGGAYVSRVHCTSKTR